MENTNHDSNLKSRKFIISLVAFGAGLTLAILNKITGQEFLTFAGVILGMYQTANVLSQKIK
jgi:hypothetical protein